MDLFLIWAILAVVVGGIAAAKGRSFWGAFFVALIFTPLIGLIVVLVSKSGSRLEQDAARRGHSATQMPCPFCAEIIQRAAKICPHCRSALPEAPPAGSAAEDFGRAAAKLLK